MLLLAPFSSHHGHLDAKLLQDHVVGGEVSRLAEGSPPKVLAIGVFQAVDEAELRGPVKLRHGLVHGGKEMLVTHGEGLGLAEVEVLGVVVDNLGAGHARSLGARLGDAVEGHEALASNVVHLAGGLGVAQDLHKGGGQVLDVAQLGDLHAGAGDGDRAAGGNAVEEPLLNGVVVERAVDVDGAHRGPVHAPLLQELLGKELALVAGFEVDLILLAVRHLVALLVHAGRRAEDVLLDVRQRVQDGLCLLGLAAVHVIHHLEALARDGGLQGLVVRAVGGDVLDGSGILGKRLVGVVGDLEGHGLLAAGEQGDLVASLDQLASKVDADETGATQHQDLLGGHGGGHHSGAAGGGARGGTGGRDKGALRIGDGLKIRQCDAAECGVTRSLLMGDPLDLHPRLLLHRCCAIAAIRRRTLTRDTA